MIRLDELHIWKKLSSPYGNSEVIPSLIDKLSKTLDKKIVDELIWEHIYHQGSVYENTLATVPHLLKIIEKSDNIEFNLDIIASLGVVLIDLDNILYLEQIFKEHNLDEKEKNSIQITFIDAMEKFKSLVNDYARNTEVLDEESKRFYLIAFLVSIKRHKEAEIFKTFNINDEYIFVCPNCEEETFLWNEENVLNAYSRDPTTNKNQEKLRIVLNESNVSLKWLEKPIGIMNINSLKPLIKYFKGDINCHSCNKTHNVFTGIMNSI
ncbi:hypothetical protein IWQ47_001574 [Aquimarina sp. EL_43]|uniref:hypothetical protein n=1 Tax=unclassified Aquimarina TaxID=2627091 RepID=UPI0018C99D00|nr:MULTISPECIES: hypothetical protein [unclassified Aquimarina]MBG6130343.1 hypothetical protein [Aquimarina sp. EL_35]MBG6149123.1 hypothetical protein [Aquimarina sp. EL_32]MBG6168503.1 hypothetical protein [Aquimarina sp. EL_43]